MNFVQQPRWKCDLGDSLTDAKVLNRLRDRGGNSISPTSRESE